MQNKQALEDFGKTIGLNGLAFNGEQICELTVDGEIEIYFQGDPLERSMQINGVIGTSPSDTRVMSALLAANFEREATGDGSISVNPMTQELTLSKVVQNAALGSEGLAPVVQDFVKYVAFWRDYYPKMSHDNSGVGDAVASDEAHTLIRG